MTEAADSQQLLEIYKLHAELADRVSQRRAGANQLFAGLLTGLVAAIGALLNFGSDGLAFFVLMLGGLVGAALAASWFIVIRSYRQLNSGKFAALHELEAKLPYPFFKREWELLEEGKSRRKYWKLTRVETFLPFTFFALSIAFFIMGLVGIV